VAAAGDDEAFAALFREERAAVLRLATLLLGDPDAAADVVADAFARMYPHWRRGRVDDPAAYLRRAVVNGVRGRWRRRTRTPVAVPVLDGDGVPIADLSGPATDRVAVQRALLALPPRTRAAIVLRFLDDLSEADTAAALGISVGTVKSSVSRGLVRLRGALEEETDR